MPERLEESRGLTVPGVGLLGGTFILRFILCLSAVPDSVASSADLTIQNILFLLWHQNNQLSSIISLIVWMKTQTQTS